MPDWTPSFDDFWMLYPRRVKRIAAERAWSRLSTAKRRLAMLALPAHMRWWRKHCSDLSTVPHPASWLNAERWADELSGQIPDLPVRGSVQVLTGFIERPKQNRAFAREQVASLKKLLASR
jgi:hypothetical protein